MTLDLEWLRFNNNVCFLNFCVLNERWLIETYLTVTYLTVRLTHPSFAEFSNSKLTMSVPVTVTTNVKEQPNCVRGLWICCNTRYQLLLDKSTAHPGIRWIVWLLIVTIYLIRAYLLQGWYIVTYALGIYILNLFISFLSPKVDPATLDYDDDGPTLPTSANEEFRPFIRRLPEFKFWHNAMRAVLVALVCTFFEIFNVPVFWPILVMYFVILFVLTMKKQILHMIHYRYLPFSYGKTRYKGKDDVPLKSENGSSVSVGPPPAVKNV